MNQQLFLIINGWAGRWPVLDALMVFCAHYLVYVLVLIVCAYAVLGYRRWRDMAIVGFISAFAARFIVASVIRFFYVHPRPGPDILSVPFHLLLVKETSSSFPSGHTIFVFALATIVYLHNKPAGRWFYVAAAFIGFARIYAGVHWPFDVVGGLMLGILTALVCDKIYRKYFKKNIEKVA